MDNDELVRKILELGEQIDIERDAQVNKNSRGHVWVTNDLGHVDVYVGDFHNQITCAKCGYVYCIACYDAPQKSCTK